MTARLPTWLSPVWLVLAGIVSVQVGAAFAKSAFPMIDPTGLAWLRMTVAAAIFWALARPRLRGRTWPQWRVVIGYGIALAVMNWSIYVSFARIPLGLAVTIEFLGPLTLALIDSHKVRDYLWVGLAAAGVALLGVFPVTVDWVGVAFALLAGASWAGYIVLGRRTGRSWEGITGSSVGSLVGAISFAIPGILLGGTNLLNPQVLLLGALIGLMSSVIPYGLEMVALRSIPAGVFSILMSVEPAVAALAALLVLGEKLSPVEMVAMGCVVIASIGATRGLATDPAPN